MEKKGITPFVKYGMFDKEQKKEKPGKNPFTPTKLFYNAKHDYYVRPMGQPMTFSGYAMNRTKTGYFQRLKSYRAKNCQGCPLNGACHKSQGTDRFF